MFGFAAFSDAGFSSLTGETWTDVDTDDTDETTTWSNV
jgi:hypothetical protein